MGQCLEESRHKLPRAFSQWITKDVLNFSSNKLTILVKCCLHGRFIIDSVPKVFIVGWSHVHHLLPRTYQNSRLSEGNQVFSKNHIVCINSLGTVNHYYKSGYGGNVPRCKPKANLTYKQDFLRIAVAGLLR